MPLGLPFELAIGGLTPDGTIDQDGPLPIPQVNRFPDRGIGELVSTFVVGNRLGSSLAPWMNPDFGADGRSSVRENDPTFDGHIIPGMGKRQWRKGAWGGLRIVTLNKRDAEKEERDDR